MATYFVENCRGYSNNSVSKAYKAGTMKSKTVAKAVSQNIRHCLRIIEAQKSVTNPALSVQNKVYIIDPHIVEMKSGDDARTFDFFEKPLFEKENRDICKVTFHEYMEHTVNERCLPGTVISNATVQVIALVLAVGRGDRPEGYTLEKWAEKSVEWAENLFGKENIFFAVLHQDEASPHMHILATPIVDGRFRGSSFHGNMETNKRVRESYLKAMDELGFQRPLPPATRRKARETEDWRREMDSRLEAVREPLEGETPAEHEKRIQDAYEKQSAIIQAQHNKSKLALDEERRELKDQKNKIRAMYSDLLSEKALFEEEKRKSAEAMKKAEAMRKECAEAMKKAEATRKEYAEAAQMGKHLMFALEHGGISPEKESMIRAIIAEVEMAYNAIEQVHGSESASDKKHFG